MNRCPENGNILTFWGLIKASCCLRQRVLDMFSWRLKVTMSVHYLNMLEYMIPTRLHFRIYCHLCCQVWFLTSLPVGIYLYQSLFSCAFLSCSFQSTVVGENRLVRALIDGEVFSRKMWSPCIALQPKLLAYVKWHICFHVSLKLRLHG